MTQQPQLSQLCELCEHINFAAILTPRDFDRVKGTTRAIYRPEYIGNGSTPTAGWMSTKERKSVQYPPGSIKVRLPITKTAHYKDLSDSDSEGEKEVTPGVKPRDRAVVVVGANDNDEDEDEDEEEEEEEEEGEEHDDYNLPNEVKDALAIDLDGIEDDDGTANDRQVYEDEGDQKSVASISTWSGNSHFTENSRIDLNKQAAGDWNYYHGDFYYLGSIWDVRSRRRRCELCKLFWGKMRRTAALKDQYVTKSRCILKLMQLNGRMVEDPTRLVKMHFLTFIYAFKVDDPKRGQWYFANPVVLIGTHRDVCEHDAQSSPGQAISFQDKHYGEARWDERLNFEIPKAWLKTCTTKHSHPPSNSEKKVSIRLIDVEKMCLVEFNALDSDIPDYVTLSYTWGAAKPRNMLKASQLDQCKTSGFFDITELNKTFRDSLTLCSKMGEKYLWIDALCIVQDDSNDKLQQIPQMREIYGRSLFTIVAAHGDDADAGLSRVTGNRSRKFKLELKDIRVSLGGSYHIHAARNDNDVGFRENYLHTCAYLSRAWTFQEGFLSPRVMIFTRDKVYWECDRCTWCENTHWESDTIDFVGLRAIKGSTPTDLWEDRFERQAWRPSDIPDVVPSNTYAAIVKEYSNRNLTWDSDILLACNGVLAYIKEQEQSDFTFGLREKHFGNDLLFNYWTALRPRFPGKSSAESGFPSWSWTAWKGSIQIANQPRGNSFDLVDDLIPCDGVRCYTLQVDEKGTRSLRVINKDGGWRFEPGYIRNKGGIYDLTDYHREKILVTGAPETPDNLKHPATDDPQSANSENHTNTKIANLTIEEKEDDITTIPTYDQTIALTTLSLHPSYPHLKPNHHITFSTFSTLVIVHTDYDEATIARGDRTPVGTVMTRAEGCWVNEDKIQRFVYACRRLPPNTPSIQEPDPCPCCGKDKKRAKMPPGYELGPYLGRLPAMSTAWDQMEYWKVAVPDGLYRMLWMNNNQLPMFGHLLVKPVSPTASKDGDWDGEIMQRMSGVIGPTQIITRERQKHYCAVWGTHILA